MTRFTTMYLPGISLVYPFVKAAIFVSGLIKLSNSFKKTAQELRIALMKAGSHEVNELVCSLHFWDQYLITNDRDECMRLFWKSRRELCSDHTDPEHAGLGYVGVLELLRGILLEPECQDDSTLLDMTLPLFIVQATEDVFVNPKNAVRFQAEKLPKSRKIVTDLDSAMQDGSVHISWLKSGHEVIQERTPFLLALVSKLAQLCGIHPKPENAWDEAPIVEEEEEVRK
jgi:pimeloyl-ACP methyl ester carboxylesterase